MTEIHFPPRELAVMSVLWRLGPSTVAEVRKGLDEDLAYTTVLSALQTLEGKGYVTHKSAGRSYRYSAAVPAYRAGRSAIDRIRESIFHGSAEAMLTQMVSDKSLSREELERMRALLDARLGEGA